MKEVDRMLQYEKLTSQRYPDVNLKIVPGHFVTPNAHVNYYFDLSTMKTRQNEAKAAAAALSDAYYATTIVDTIVCEDGTEVIGAYLSEELTRIGVISMNQHKTLYIVTPEYNPSGQMIFRENMMPMIRDKHVLLLEATITTGRTMQRTVESLLYYGAEITGVSAIFSQATKVGGLNVHALFTKRDVPDYAAYDHANCALCRINNKITAICNGHGIAQI